MAAIAEIPLTEVGAGGASDLLDAHVDAAVALIDTALATHPLLPLAAKLADRMSRRWLERQQNPYLEEIARVARRLPRPGAYFLNIIYEWACSTSSGPDPNGFGARLIRVLDWGLKGIGRQVVLARHKTPHGPFYSATWPGFAGVLTAMAPARFSGAINQAPRIPVVGSRWLDEPLGRVLMLRGQGVVPAAHLLRRVFEQASDYAAARTLLADETIVLAMPALFTLSGISGEQSCVIEAIGSRRRVHDAAAEDAFTVGVANDWLSDDLPGVPRAHAAERSSNLTRTENNRVRRSAICAIQRGSFLGAGCLQSPVLNSHTVLVASANAATGEMIVEGLDPVPGSGVPRVTARRALSHA